MGQETTAARIQKGSLPLELGFVRAQEGVWRQSARSNLQFRDLGVHGASKGLLNAQHIRATAAGNRKGWHGDDVEFHYVQVMAGTLTLQDETGARVTLNTGDSVIQPPFRYDPDVFDYSADFEALEFTSAGSYAHIEAFMHKAGQTPTGVAEHPGVNRDIPDSYIVGDGPRSFFSYRDLGATAASGRRMHIHVVGIAAQPPGGTGWHNHSMDQFFMPFTGELEITVETIGTVTIGRGDAMYIPAGIRHNVTGFTLDYTVVEVCIPTDYDTTDAAPPAGYA